MTDTVCCWENIIRSSYLAALSKLNPETGGSRTFDSAILHLTAASLRVPVRLRSLFWASPLLPLFRFWTENGETLHGLTSQRSQHRGEWIRTGWLSLSTDSAAKLITRKMFDTRMNRWCFTWWKQHRVKWHRRDIPRVKLSVTCSYLLWLTLFVSFIEKTTG